MQPYPEDRIADAVASGKLTSDSAARVRTWLTRDSLSRYRDRISQLIQEENWTTLESLFWTSIPFGTGGRRGPMGELGPATINDRTIAESADGMARYLRSTGRTEGGAAVIACDSRHRSPEFARLTACTLAAHGLQVFLFQNCRSTPELSFAVRQLRCDIGVMISASHNPPGDNGFKAYWSNGAQVIPPHDHGIIREVERCDEIPSTDFKDAVDRGQIVMLGDDIDRQYIDQVVKLSQSTSRQIHAVFTPLHGVGESSVYAVIRRAGFEYVTIFEGHRTPDGAFPNVPNHLPNPENLEVFDPVMAWIRQTGHPAQMILASDPDADRLGVMIRNASGSFTPLSGNQVGALLTDFLLRKRKQAGRFSSEDYVVQTLVTSPLIRATAEFHGARAFWQLLVGFKYIAQTIEEQGADHFVFGAEESIGFLAGDYCRDKDAAVAALLILELAAELSCAGRTLTDQLDELYTKCGYHCESQKSISCEGPTGKARIDALMQALRQTPPSHLGKLCLTDVCDYGTGQQTAIPAGTTASMIPGPRGDMLIFRTKATDPVRAQIAVRPSGTEPKIKFYLFCQTDVPGSEDLIRARAAGDAAMSELRQAISEWAAGRLNA